MAILTGTADRDNIFGTAGDDTVSGGAGRDGLYGDTGHDTLDGGTGSDVLDGGAGNDKLTGGAGNDFIGGADGADTAYGGLDSDTIGGGAGRDLLFGEAGADTLHGEVGNDSLFGGSGDDNLLGGADNDSLYAGPGQDLLSGGAGADNLCGGDGADSLDGGIGDNLYGEAGDDVLIWDTEQFVLGPWDDGPNTTISGGDGYDTLRINVDLLYYVWSFLEGFQPGPIVSDVNLYHSVYGGGGTLIKLGNYTPEDVPGLSVNLDGIERIEVSGLGRLVYFNSAFPGDPYSGPSNITLVGTAQDDYLGGGYGEEVLIGAAGNDDISGGIGADHLEGGIGQDRVSGGSDADLFVYAFDPNSPLAGGQKAYGLDGNDIIMDFSGVERDVVRLDAIPDMTPAQANAICGDASEILVTQTAEKAVLTFGSNGATIQFDTLGVNNIGAIGGNTLQALEAKIIGVSGDSAYDPFQIA